MRVIISTLEQARKSTDKERRLASGSSLVVTGSDASFLLNMRASFVKIRCRLTYTLTARMCHLRKIYPVNCDEETYEGGEKILDR